MFAKVYSQIFDSSIAENYTVRHVFMDLLVLSDSEGVVDMTLSAISRRTNVPIDVIRDAITVLSEPDEASRSEVDEGRRIALVDTHRDWGWRIINYEHYRKLRDEEGRRSYHRDYMKKYRNGSSEDAVKPVKSRKEVLRPVKSCEAPLTHAEAEGEAEEVPPPSLSGFAEFWEKYPKKVGKGAAEKSWKTMRCFKIPEKILSAVESAKKSDGWRKEDGRYIPNPATYLNQKRWEDSNETVSLKSTTPLVVGENTLTFDRWREQA